MDFSFVSFKTLFTQISIFFTHQYANREIFMFTWRNAISVECHHLTYIKSMNFIHKYRHDFILWLWKLVYLFPNKIFILFSCSAVRESSESRKQHQNEQNRVLSRYLKIKLRHFAHFFCVLVSSQQCGKISSGIRYLEEFFFSSTTDLKVYAFRFNLVVWNLIICLLWVWLEFGECAGLNS